MKSQKKTRRPETEILTNKSPFIFTEAYKSLRTNVDFILSSNDSKIVMVTSAIPQEGKTSLSINLAASLAQTGKKVILLDCDLRKPKVHSYLRIKHSSQFGVSTVLKGTTGIDEAIGYVESLNLYVMLSGPIYNDPSELLNSATVPNMFKELSERFDYVICDTAPVSVVTDAAVLNRCCDGVVFVIRQNYANSRQVKDAIGKLEAVNANILGCVLNRYDSKSDMTYTYDKYYYYHEYSHEEE